MVLTERTADYFHLQLKIYEIMLSMVIYPFSKTTSGTISPFMLFNVMIVVTLSCAR